MITITETFSARGGFPIEGFIPFLALERSGDHALLLDAAFPALTQAGAGHAVKVKTAPGSYVLHRYMRICDGNCGLLDPPTASCRKTLHLNPGQHVVLHIRASIAGCAIRRRRPRDPAGHQETRSANIAVRRSSRVALHRSNRQTPGRGRPGTAPWPALRTMG